MRKMIEIPMRTSTRADFIRNIWAPFRKPSRLDLQRSLIVARTFVERRLPRGADWRAQLDRAWEDCKRRNS